MEKVEAFGVGDFFVLETSKHFECDPKARIADVRTRAEWAIAGVPARRVRIPGERRALFKGPIAAKFMERRGAALAARSVGKTTEIFSVAPVLAA